MVIRRTARAGSPTKAPAQTRTTPKAQRRAALAGKKPAAGSPAKAAILAGGASVLRSIPVVGGVAGGVMDAKAAYDAAKKQGMSDEQARRISGHHKRKQGALNKRARKTIKNAIKYHKQLKKAMQGIEKMAGKAHIRRSSGHGGGGRFRPWKRS